MRKLLILPIIILSMFLVTPMALAQIGQDVVEIDQQVDRATMEQITRQDGPHFRGGESVWISEDLVGDVYVGGGNVRVESNIDGDLLVGGGTVTINGHVTRDLRVGAGQVTIDGIVDGNVSIGAGTVTFTKNSVVLGSVVVGAGQAIFDGNIGGQVYSWVGEVEGNGEFGKNFQGAAGSLILGPLTNVKGDVMFKTESQPQISEESQIAGRRDIRIIEKTEEEKRSESWRNSLDAGGLIMRVLMAIVSASILYYFFPQLATALSKQVIDNSLPAMGWGMVHLIILPIVALLFAVTLLGLPIGVLIGLLYIVGLMVSGWVVSFAVGQKIFEISKVEILKNPFVQIITGIIVLSVLSNLPFLGGLTQLIKLLLGMGAIFILEKEALSKCRLRKKA